MSELKMSYENFFGAKTSVTLFISLKTKENSPKEAMKDQSRNWRASRVGIQYILWQTGPPQNSEWSILVVWTAKMYLSVIVLSDCSSKALYKSKEFYIILIQVIISYVWRIISAQHSR